MTKFVNKAKAFLAVAIVTIVTFIAGGIAQAQSNAENVGTALETEFGLVETAMISLLTVVLVGLIGMKLIKKGANRAT